MLHDCYNIKGFDIGKTTTALPDFVCYEKRLLFNQKPNNYNQNFFDLLVP